MLGTHVWQAGAHKGVDKARLDITHYRNLTQDERDRLEEKANEAVDLDIPIHQDTMTRREAEAMHGFDLYQGGYVPGNELRVVEIQDLDVEACGGTHYTATGETGRIVILGSNTVQDGVIRIEFKAGQAADDYIQWKTQVLNTLQDEIDFDSLEALTEIFDVNIDELVTVVDRFIQEWEGQEETIKELDPDWEDRERPRDAEELFNSWKQQQKTIDRLKQEYVDEVVQDVLGHDPGTTATVQVPFNDLGLLMQAVNKVEGERDAVVCGPEICAATRTQENADETLEQYCDKVDGGEDVAKGFVCTPPSPDQ
jgi:alanyl-tRNA synthetase